MRQRLFRSGVMKAHGFIANASSRAADTLAGKGMA